MKTLTKLSSVLLATTVLSGAAQAAPWQRSFAVDAFGPAAYYAGKTGTDEKAADCPGGVNPGIDVAAAVQRTAWRTPEERKTMIANATQTLDDAATQRMMSGGADGAQAGANAGGGGYRPVTNNRTNLAYRGFAPDVNTYFNPMAAPDPGMTEVSGTIAYGFDLDDNPTTGGFVSPDGVRGIDNSYYRALGCTYALRGAPGQAYEIQFSNDHMRDGLQTMVLRLTGAQDMMNDSDVTVEIGYSPDDLVKDARSGVAQNYSFRVGEDSGKFTRFKGAIVNGELFVRDLKELRTIDFAYMETLAIDPLILFNARIRLKLKPDGTLEGMMGGYREWPQYYLNDAWTQPILTGNGRETFFHTDLLATYHALARNADGLPDAKGRMMGISTAYQFTAVPAQVITPDTPLKYDPMNPAARRDRNLFLKIFAEGKVRRDNDPEMVKSLANPRAELIGAPPPVPGAAGAPAPAAAAVPIAAAETRNAEVASR
jgi:hypothetical protein